jgi:hypothetical protein
VDAENINNIRHISTATHPQHQSAIETTFPRVDGPFFRRVASPFPPASLHFGRFIFFPSFYVPSIYALFFLSASDTDHPDLLSTLPFQRPPSIRSDLHIQKQKQNPNKTKKQNTLCHCVLCECLVVFSVDFQWFSMIFLLFLPIKFEA